MGEGEVGSRGPQRDGEALAAGSGVYVSLQGCLIAAMILLSSLTVHPILRLIITMEISIFSFFILLYSFAIHRYIPFILWPIL